MCLLASQFSVFGGYIWNAVVPAVVLPDYVNITSRIAATDRVAHFLSLLFYCVHCMRLLLVFLCYFLTRVCENTLLCVNEGLKAVCDVLLIMFALACTSLCIRDHHLPLFKALDEVNASQCKEKRG